MVWNEDAKAVMAGKNNGTAIRANGRRWARDGLARMAYGLMEGLKHMSQAGVAKYREDVCRLKCGVAKGCLEAAPRPKVDAVQAVVEDPAAGWTARTVELCCSPGSQRHSPQSNRMVALWRWTNLTEPVVDSHTVHVVVEGPDSISVGRLERTAWGRQEDYQCRRSKDDGQSTPARVALPNHESTQADVKPRCSARRL